MSESSCIQIIPATALIYTDVMDQHQHQSETATSAPLHPDRLTWAALLAQWVEFAQSAVGLPSDEQGRRMRESVADVIMLQAVWFALQHLQGLGAEERALGLDRAGVLIEKHQTALTQRWGDDMPTSMRELIEDAQTMWTKANGG